MKVRAVGDRAWGWAEAAISWGAEVEVVAHDEPDNHHLRKLFDIPILRNYTTAATTTLPQQGQ